MLTFIIARLAMLIKNTYKGQVVFNSVRKLSTKIIFVIMINIGFITAFAVPFLYTFGVHQEQMDTFLKNILVLSVFAIRSSLFGDFDDFDTFGQLLFLAAYVLLVSVVSVYLQVLFADIVRNVFIDSEKPVFYSGTSQIKKCNDIVNLVFFRLLTCGKAGKNKEQKSVMDGLEQKEEEA